MDPVTTTAVQDLAGQASQNTIGADVLPEVDAADQAKFDAAMQADSGPIVQNLGQVQGTPGVGVTPPAEVTTLGDVVLNQLQSVQDSHHEGLEKVNELFADGELTMVECFHVQMEFSRMHIEMEMAAKTSDKTSQGIQQLMKQQ